MTKQHYKLSEFRKAIYDGIPLERILKPYSTIRLRKKRNQKKFKKNPKKYIGNKTSRHLLAAYMVMPLRRSMNYGSIGRKTFQLEELPQGALSVYSLQKVVSE